MTECLVGAIPAQRSSTDIKTQPTRRDYLGVVIANHKPRDLGFENRSLRIQESFQKAPDIRSRGLNTAPGRAECAPVRAVPVPLLRARRSTSASSKAVSLGRAASTSARVLMFGVCFSLRCPARMDCALARSARAPDSPRQSPPRADGARTGAGAAGRTRRPEPAHRAEM